MFGLIFKALEKMFTTFAKRQKHTKREFSFQNCVSIVDGL